MKQIQIDKNSIILDDLNNISQNFDNLLTIKDSITYSNCSNIDINIKSSINKLTIKNTDNAKIKINKTVSGIDLIRCNKIEIITTDKKPIYYMLIEDSENIEITINKKMFKNTEIDIIDSSNILLQDFDKTKHFKL